MKAFISYCLCFSLLMTSLLAQEQKSDNSHFEASQSNESEEIKAPHLKKGEDTGGILKTSILLFGITFAGVAIAKKCLKRASSGIFLASAFSYIMAEITLFSGFYTEGKESIKTHKVEGKNDRQVSSIREASKRSKKASQAALAKSIIQGVAGGGFLAASSMSIIETALDWPTYTGSCFAHNDLPSSLPDDPFSRALELLFPRVHAFSKGGELVGMLAAMGIGAAAAAAITASTTGTIKKTFAKVLSNGYSRAAVYAAFAGVAFWSSSDAAKVSDELKHNSREYSRLADDLSKKSADSKKIEATDNGETFTTSEQSISPSSIGTLSVKEKELKIPQNCVKGENLAQAQPDEGCLCRQDKTCTQVEFVGLNEKPPTVPEIDSLKEVVGGLSQTTNALFQGDVDQAVLEGKKLNQAVHQLKKKQRDYIKLVEKKEGGPQMTSLEDWDLLTHKTQQYLVKKVQGALQGLPPKDRALLTLLTPGQGSPKALSHGKRVLKSKKFPQKTKGAHGLKDQKGKRNAFSFLDDEEDKALIRRGRQKVKIRGGRAGTFTRGKNSSSKAVAKRNGDLFRIISKRYTESAYPLFFPKEE